MVDDGVRAGVGPGIACQPAAGECSPETVQGLDHVDVSGGAGRFALLAAVLDVGLEVFVAPVADPWGKLPGDAVGVQCSQVSDALGDRVRCHWVGRKMQAAGEYGRVARVEPDHGHLPGQQIPLRVQLAKDHTEAGGSQVRGPADDAVQVPAAGATEQRRTGAFQDRVGLDDGLVVPED
ncbi:hypothetical protein ABT382_27620 [Streptomyces pharetrae]|uniref:hypothetical protein n=1 Tax=Streptomyces pharetrae TaxID=291370 RepID=UPI0033648882